VPPPPQVCGDVQVMPQPPQLNGLMLRSVQLPLQHAGVIAVVQVTPQLPQLLTSVTGSEQLPVQQLLPFGQALPHVPQLLVDARSAHALPQQAGVVPVHTVVQVPQ
jgi:hypothetical protein